MSQDTHNVVQSEVIVVGGGLVGMAVAYGLARRGVDTVVLDPGDEVFRASRGPFGLVWVQCRGHDLPDYSRWARVIGAALAGAGASAAGRQQG